mmetsp:Transcript_43012/g.102110  ORF Transcript_43012/g.102110 Transcript_43012/m.102110 type:complete len:217 (-) Transcript_43012:443-1093(-)
MNSACPIEATAAFQALPHWLLSMMMARGMLNRQAKMESRPNRLMPSRLRSLKSERHFFERMLRMTMPRFDPMAKRNPGQPKLSSFMAEREQPATIGTSESHTYAGAQTPRNGPDRATANTGSADFTMCANETAMRLKLTQAVTWPTVCAKATGSSCLASLKSTLGAGCSLNVHSMHIQRPETTSCIADMKYGQGKALSDCLLMMLKTMLNAYHSSM